MQTEYRGLNLIDTPVGDAAIALNDNFIMLADRTGPMNTSSTDPTVSDDATKGYSHWSKWYNAVTNKVFICTDSSPGAAAWQSYYSLSNDATPRLTSDMFAGENVVNVRNISSDTATVMTMQDVRFKMTGVMNLHGNDITNFGSMIYLKDAGQITSDTGSLSLSAASIKLGVMNFSWPSSIGANGTYLCDNNAGSMVFSAEARPCAPGTVCMWTKMTAPTGWVLCDGTIYNGTNAVYTDLYNEIGNLWGGTGQASFKVPDFRGRTLFGMDGTSDFYSVTTAGGAKTVTLNSSHTPPHTHSIYTYTAAGSNAGTWTSALSAACGVATGTFGSGTAHNNLNPYALVCWIIKL